MPPRVDWYYHRKGCQSCKRADGVLDKSGAAVAEQVDARKVRLGPKDAVRLARSVDHLWVAKGKKIDYFNMKKDKVSDAELVKRLIGPTGNLRAPTVRRGKKLFVGFHAEAMEENLL